MAFNKITNRLEPTTLIITSAILTIAVLGLPFTQTVNAAGPGGDEIPYAESLDKHFHPKGNPPSEHTLAIIRKARETMPFSDRRDYEEAEKGFMAPLNSKIIKADAGHVAWDIERYDFFT